MKRTEARRGQQGLDHERILAEVGVQTSEKYIFEFICADRKRKMQSMSEAETRIGSFCSHERINDNVRMKVSQGSSAHLLRIRVSCIAKK